MILIIEDDIGLCELIQENLIEFDHAITCFHSASQAIDWLESNTPYLILLDYNLPDMNGKEFINELKRLNKSVPPFVVSTGQGDERIAVELMKLGAKDYIIKDILFLEMLPEVIKRVSREIDNENKRLQAEADLQLKNIELAELNASKDKFFSILAHDLKSPFSGFLGLTKIIAEEYQDLTMKEVQEYGEKMQESANNLYELLDNLLQWANMQRGGIEFNPEICTLSTLVNKNLNIVKEFANIKNIQLSNSISENLAVTVDIPMLNTVIRNLISNAIKFTPKGGKIEIGEFKLSDENELADKNKIVCIYFKDSGIGMKKEIIDNLFKIDVDISRPGTEGEPSTGLGLLLCKDFVEKQGGKIWVESEEGKGSTFYFSLPNNSINHL